MKQVKKVLVWFGTFILVLINKVKAVALNEAKNVQRYAAAKDESMYGPLRPGPFEVVGWLGMIIAVITTFIIGIKVILKKEISRKKKVVLCIVLLVILMIVLFIINLIKTILLTNY